MKRKKDKPKTVPLDAAWSPFGRCQRADPSAMQNRPERRAYVSS